MSAITNALEELAHISPTDTTEARAELSALQEVAKAVVPLRLQLDYVFDNDDDKRLLKASLTVAQWRAIRSALNAWKKLEGQ